MARWSRAVDLVGQQEEAPAVNRKDDETRVREPKRQCVTRALHCYAR